MLQKKLLIICTQMEPGGVQRLAIELRKDFIKLGCRADILFIYKKRDILGEENFEVLFQEKTLNPFKLLKNVFFLLKRMKAVRYDAVLGFAHYSSPFASMMGALAGIKHRAGTQTNPPRESKIFAIPLDKLAGSFGGYTVNIAASHAIADCFENYPKSYKENLRVIHNGVRTIPASIGRNEARSRLGINIDDKVLVNCGRLSEQKNQKFIVDLMNKLPEEFKLRILGEGELREEIQNYINENGLENRVKLVGEVSPQEVSNFLIAGDIFVFPSLYEAFGLAMVEAMAVGLPVICSDHPALQEVGKGAAKIIPLGKKEEWISEIIKISSNENLIKDMVNEGYVVSEKFSFSKMSNAFYNSIFA
ncbi:MAG: hypothetical protein DI540_25465 [Sphingobium sp.]|nr:MAG: hypothetical protein DI540_25465 [Sphingobium sp.]